jgi:RNA recognition motif-containing protein
VYFYFFSFFFIGYPMNIYVGNIAHASTEDGLKQLFEQFGSVATVRIIMDRMTGKPRGFAFVEMANDTEATHAIESLNGTDFDGRTLRVNQAQPQAERSPRPFSPRGGDRGGSRGRF